MGVGEVEESTIKDLDETRRELRGMTVALADVKEQNHQLRLRIATLEKGQNTDA